MNRTISHKINILLMRTTEKIGKDTTKFNNDLLIINCDDDFKKSHIIYLNYEAKFTTYI